MTMTDAELDRLLQLAAPVRNELLEVSPVRDAARSVFDSARDGRVPLTSDVMVLRMRRARRARRGLLVSAVGAAVVMAGAGAAAAGWVDLHTGFFGSPDDTEGDTTEYFDTRSPELPGLLRKYAEDTPLAPGAELDPLIESIAANPGLQQEAGLRGSVALHSACTWERYWLASFSSDDADGQARAVVVLRQIPTWPALVAVDGDRLAADAAARAEAAAAGDPTPLERNVSINCGPSR